MTTAPDTVSSVGFASIGDAIPVTKLAWLFVGFGVAWICSLGTLSYAGHVLGPDAFGLYNFGASVSAIASTAIAPGLNLWGARRIARDPSAAGELLIVVNAVQTLLAVLAYAAMAIVVSAVFGARERDICLAAGVVLFSIALSAQWVGQGLEQFHLVAIGQALGAASALAGVVVLVHGPSDVNRVPVIIALGQLGAAAVVVGLLLVGRHIRFRALRMGGFQGLSTALALGLSTVIIGVLHHANNVFLQIFRGSDAVGLLAAGLRILELLGVVPTVIAMVFLPRIARLHAKNPASTRDEMSLLVTIVMSLAFLPAVILLAAPEAMTDLLYGSEFRAATGVVRLMGVALIFNWAAIAYLNGLVAVGRDRAFLLGIVVAMIVSVVGGVLTVPRYGVVAATVIVASLDVFTLVSVMPSIQRHFGVAFMRDWLVPLASALPAAVVLMLQNGSVVPLPIRLILAACTYGALLVGLNLWGAGRWGSRLQR